MKSDRFERLSGLVAEVQRKRELITGLATQLKGKQDTCDAQWNQLQPLAGATADLTKLTPDAWNLLPANSQDQILSQLAALIAALDDALEDEGSGGLMSKRLVSTLGIVLLALYGFSVTGSVLWVIATNWERAVPQPNVATAVKEEKARLEKEIVRLSRVPSEPEVITELEHSQRELDAVTNLPKLVSEAMSEPEEGLALRMVVYMGMLGASLHVLQSLGRYVGDRKLIRSWLLYYIAAPVQGGGLALLIYLLLRVGVLAPAENGSGGIGQANIIGIYAFAGLTGMFAKPATQKLGEVFLTLFRSEKPAGDAVKEQPKAKSG